MAGDILDEIIFDVAETGEVGGENISEGFCRSTACENWIDDQIVNVVVNGCICCCCSSRHHS